MDDISVARAIHALGIGVDACDMHLVLLAASLTTIGAAVLGARNTLPGLQ